MISSCPLFRRSANEDKYVIVFAVSDCSDRRFYYSQAAAMNKQGNLNDFFDVSAGSGTYAPRKRQAYSSKRLQQVVSEFRSEKAKLQKSNSPTPAISEGCTGSGADNDAEEGPVKKRRKTKGKGKEGPAEGSTSRKVAGRGRGRGRGRGTTAASAGRKKAVPKDSEEDGDEYVGDTGDVVGFVPQLRPRPKPKPAKKGKVGSDSDGV
jgi:DNA excision repair protein ERCC-5